jgi:hypothetical protein
MIQKLSTLSGLRRAHRQLDRRHSRFMIHSQGPSLLKRLLPFGEGGEQQVFLGLLRTDREFHKANDWDWYVEYCLSEQETGPNIVNEPTVRRDEEGEVVEHFCYNPTDATLLREFGNKKNWVVIYKVCGDAIAEAEGKIRDKMVYPLPLEPCIDEPEVSNI